MEDATREAAAPDRPLRVTRRVSAAELVYRDMRERILSLELAPDTPLSRSELAGTYGVSLTPVREALLRLQQEGLIETYPQSRTVVSRIDASGLSETHFLRAALEIEVARTLTRKREPGLLRDAEQALERQREIGTDRSRVNEFSQLDQQFHGALFTAAGQAGLHDLIRSRSGHLDRVRRLHLPTEGKMASIIADHEAILSGIRSGDEGRASAAVRAHLSGTVQSIDAIIRSDPKHFAAA